MRLKPGLFKASAEAHVRYCSDLPYPLELLFDREDLGRGLELVEQAAQEAWFRLPAGAMVHVFIEQESVVRAELLEGEAAARATIEHGMRLPKERAEWIRQVLCAGVEVELALDALFGEQRLDLQLLLDQAMLRYRMRRWVVHHHAPERSVVLELVEFEGRLLRSELREGQAAWNAWIERG